MSVLKWDAVPALGLPSFELSLPDNAAGTVLVYKVPPCEKYPDGYFFALDRSTSSSTTIVPSCASWEYVLLCKATIVDKTKTDDDHMAGGSDMILYQHPLITIDMDAFAPKKEVD